MSVDDTDAAIYGSFAYGIFAQSVGGSGGAGGSTFSGGISGGSKTTVNAAVSVGGSGATGSSAGSVSVFNSAQTIRTLGDHATGIVAQSIGGGGGSGGGTMTVAAAGTTGNSASINGSINIGGAGGGGSDGGDVTVTSSSDITTGFMNSAGEVISGDFAYGILAQSVGGGAPLSTSSYAASISKKGSPMNLGGGKGGDAGEGGRSGNVVVNLSGDITTMGDFAYGFFAQSIGGGGGAGGSSESLSLSASKEGDKTIQGNASVGVGGQGGSGGVSGNVTVNADDSGNAIKVLTLGALAKGFVAQSIGGGGGSGGTASSSSYSKSKSKYTFGADANVSGEGGKGESLDWYCWQQCHNTPENQHRNPRR